MKRNEIYNVEVSKCYTEETIDLITVEVKPCKRKACSLKRCGLLLFSVYAET
jgi:hypothetical protein